MRAPKWADATVDATAAYIIRACRAPMRVMCVCADYVSCRTMRATVHQPIARYNLKHDDVFFSLLPIIYPACARMEFSICMCVCEPITLYGVMLWLLLSCARGSTSELRCRSGPGVLARLLANTEDNLFMGE